MEDKKLTSQRSTRRASATSNPGINPSRISSVSDNQVKHDTDLPVLTELRDFFQRLAAPTPPKPWWKRLATHPLFILLIGSAVSFFIGSRLTYEYTRKAQEISAERSFSDEMNRLRIQKVGEVWERLDEDEVAITNLVNELADKPAADKAARNAVLEQIARLIDTDKGVIAQHRFWLSQVTYDKMGQYPSANIFLLTREILDPEADDIPTLRKARDDAKTDIEKERARFLNPKL
jgi:hypothetical protein